MFAFCRFLFLGLALLGTPIACFSQPFHLDWLFRSGGRLQLGIFPQVTRDSVEFGYTHAQLGAIVPFGGRAKVSLRELDISGSQNFLNIVAGRRVVRSNIFEESLQVNNASVGITHLSASLRGGLWAYVGNIGFLQTVGVSGVSPFGVLGIANIKIKGLRKHNIWGVALAYFNEQLLPAPVVGFNRKIAKSWDLRLLLPVNVTVAYRHNRNNSFDFRLSSQVFQSRFSFTEAATAEKRTSSWRYNHWQLGSLWRHKVGRGWFLNVEAGLAMGAGLRLEATTSPSQRIGLGLRPYAQLNTSFDLGKQLLGSQLFATE